MSGFHLDPDGDVYAQARGKIEGLVAYLAQLKNIPADDAYLAQFAALIVESMELRDLYKAVHVPDPAVLHQLVWRTNNELDWRAAVIAVRIFAEASDVGLSDSELCEVASTVIDRMKGANPVSAATCLWPTTEEIAAIAHREIVKSRPVSAAELAAVILPVVLPRPANLKEILVLGGADEWPSSEAAEALI